MARLDLRTTAQEMFGLLFAIRSAMFEQIEATDTEPLGGLADSYRATEQVLADFGHLSRSFGRLPERVQALLMRTLRETKVTDQLFRSFVVTERERLVNMILDAGEVGNEALVVMVTVRGIQTNVPQVRIIRRARTKRLAPPTITPKKKTGRRKSRGGRSTTEEEKEAILHLFTSRDLTDEKEIKQVLANELEFPDVTLRSIKMIISHVLRQAALETEEIGEKDTSSTSAEPTSHQQPPAEA